MESIQQEITNEIILHMKESGILICNIVTELLDEKLLTTLDKSFKKEGLKIYTYSISNGTVNADVSFRIRTIDLDNGPVGIISSSFFIGKMADDFPLDNISYQFYPFKMSF
jgi:hypothetical protein